MTKDKVITLFVALMCISPVCGSFLVICHGSDGHVAVEPVAHNHCVCPGSEAPAHHDESTKGLTSDHGHCTDTLAASSIVISALKKHQLAKIFAHGLQQNPIYARITTSCERLFSCNTEISPFFTPLRTIIIQA